MQWESLATLHEHARRKEGAGLRVQGSHWLHQDGSVGKLNSRRMRARVLKLKNKHANTDASSPTPHPRQPLAKPLTLARHSRTPLPEILCRCVPHARNASTLTRMRSCGLLRRASLPTASPPRNSLALVLLLYGDSPGYLPWHLQTASDNSDVDFHYFALTAFQQSSASSGLERWSDNVFIRDAPSSLLEARLLKLGIAPELVRRFGDENVMYFVQSSLKLLAPALFNDQLSSYSFVGWADTDVLFGKIVQSVPSHWWVERDFIGFTQDARTTDTLALAGPLSFVRQNPRMDQERLAFDAANSGMLNAPTTRYHEANHRTTEDHFYQHVLEQGLHGESASLTISTCCSPLRAHAAAPRDWAFYCDGFLFEWDNCSRAHHLAAGDSGRCSRIPCSRKAALHLGGWKAGEQAPRSSLLRKNAFVRQLQVQCTTGNCAACSPREWIVGLGSAGRTLASQT